MSKENSIYRSLDVIEKRINEKLTVESIAAEVNISKYHYMRLFREVVGDSVMDYINKRKLTLAADELLESNAKILDIAFDYGYDSREGFSRSFKTLMGVTPAEYRKNAQDIITVKFGKEYSNMKYAKTISTVYREINEWIQKAKDLAAQMRQTYSHTNNVFWNGVAEQTENLICSINVILELVDSIAHKPDEITDGMKIVKIIDDTAFIAHSIAFQIELMEAREPENCNENLFAEKYRELAWLGVEKAKVTSDFFRELLLLVIEDMRKASGQKINNAINTGILVVESIPVSHKYIKEEILHLIKVMSETPVELITMQMLDDSYFKIKLITITAKLRIDKTGNALFDNLQNLSDALYDASSFCGGVVKPVTDPSPEQQNVKVMQDIVYMENVIFFYANGEMDYLCRKLNGPEYQEQKDDFEEIKIKINDYRGVAFYAERDENDISVFKSITNKLSEIISDLYHVANNCGTHGGAIKLIADELSRLADKTRNLAEDTEGL